MSNHTVKQTLKNMAFDSKTAAAAGKRSSRKGKPNRTTSELREMIMALLERNVTQIQKDLEALEPKERVNAWLKLLEFQLPKPRETDPIGEGPKTNVPVIVFTNTPGADCFPGLNETPEYAKQRK